jgi:hypothetical protein
MGVPGLIGVLERICGHERWIKMKVSTQKLKERAAIVGRTNVIAVDAMNFLFYLAGLKESRGYEEEVVGFCNLLREFGLKALCIFDSAELSEERQKRAKIRKAQRREATKELEESGDKEDLNNVMNARRLEVLRTRTICVTPSQVARAREIFEQSGVCEVVEAPDEADTECVDAVNNRRAFACLSNDSDMFVTGCSRILRMYSPGENTFELWDVKRLYNYLHLSQEQFSELVKMPEGERRSHSELYNVITGRRVKARGGMMRNITLEDGSWRQKRDEKRRKHTDTEKQERGG